VIGSAVPYARRLRMAGCRLLLGQTFCQAAAVSRSTEWLPPTAVRDRQWDGVLEIVRAAREAGAPGAGRLDAGMTPGRFAEVPPLTREELRRAVGADASPRLRGMRRASGGSGGAGLAVPIDRGVYSWYMAGTWRGFSWWGVDIAQPAVLLLGHTARPPLHRLLGAVKDRAVGWHRVPVDVAFDARAAELLEAVNAPGPVALYGYPSAVDRLARAQRGHPHMLRRLKVIVLTGEPLYEFQRRRIEETFQCPVAEEYGMGELGSVAFECQERRLHISAETVFLEVVPDALSDGTSRAGRILATHLRNRVFPLIRYDTGDIGVMPGEGCPCGRGLPVLRVYGRADDRLTGPAGVAPAKPWLDRFFGLLPDSLQGSVRVVQDAPGALRLQIAPDAAAAAADPAAAARTAAAGVPGPAWTITVEERLLHRVPSGKLALFTRA